MNDPGATAQAISVHQTSLGFAAEVGVFNLDFRVPRGTIFGLIGPSGCGKTTTVRLLTGVYQPQSGEVRVLGSDPRHFTARERKQIGYVPQHFALYPNLTVTENLNFSASMYGLSMFGRRKRFRTILDFVQLTDARYRLVRKLSGGMQRRLLLASALVHQPALLFADEPTAGIDPILRQKFWNYFRQLRDNGRTLFITTQYVGEVAYCDLVGVMSDGRMVHVDTPANLRHKALGGELLKIEVAPAQSIAALQHLLRVNGLRDVRRSRRQPGVIYANVDAAAPTLPLVVRVLQEENQILVQSVEPYLPPFDEVFVHLLGRPEEQNV